MHFRASPQRPRNRSRSEAAFTIVEVVVAAGVIAIFTSAAIVAMVQMNRFATAMRLRTLAGAVAQQQIDEVLTTSWVIGTRPDVLQAGTRTTPNLPLNDDSFSAQAGIGSAFSGLDGRVAATRTITVADLTARTVRATVTVDFNYRGRPYSVLLTTIRTTDTI